MSPEIYNLIIGTGIGALISSISYYYKRRQENKKKLNKVLFTMLEIWGIVYWILQIDEEEILQKYQQFLRKKGITGSFPDEEKTIIKHALKGFMNNLLERRKNLSEKDLQKVYNNAIHEISLNYPILAYEMNKDRGLEKILDFADQYFEQTNSVYAPSTKEELEFWNKMKEYFKNKIAKDVLESLENDISKIARKSSYWNWFLAKNKIRKKKNQEVIPEGFFEENIEKIFELDNKSCTPNKAH